MMCVRVNKLILYDTRLDDVEHELYITVDNSTQEYKLSAPIHAFVLRILTKCFDNNMGRLIDLI